MEHHTQLEFDEDEVPLHIPQQCLSKISSTETEESEYQELLQKSMMEHAKMETIFEQHKERVQELLVKNHMEIIPAQKDSNCFLEATAIKTGIGPLYLRDMVCDVLINKRIED